MKSNLLCPRTGHRVVERQGKDKTKNATSDGSTPFGQRTIH